MLNAVLKTLGYSVQVAETGADGLRIVPGFRPDVVLLGMALPGIPGEIVLDCLHAADARLPVCLDVTCMASRLVTISPSTRLLPDLAHPRLPLPFAAGLHTVGLSVWRTRRTRRGRGASVCWGCQGWRSGGRRRSVGAARHGDVAAPIRGTGAFNCASTRHTGTGVRAGTRCHGEEGNQGAKNQLPHDRSPSNALSYLVAAARSAPLARRDHGRA
jgi:hypothetical protein